MEPKQAVVRHQDGSDWIVEVLPNKHEANQWAGMFREQALPGVTYTVEPYADLVKP